MPMTTTVTLAYEGAPSCVDCQRAGVGVCDHVGFTETAWVYLPGQAVHVPGLDPAFTHVVHDAAVSPDRKTVTLVVSTERPQFADLARHLSMLHSPKAAIRAVHADTGDVLAEGRYDAPLADGDLVYINGTRHSVVSTEWPDRSESGTSTTGFDTQVVRLSPIPEESVTPVQQ
jgi:hypothetical protein